MDPLGLAFESYDGIGRYRTMDVGKTIDASGKLTGAEPEGAPLQGRHRADEAAGHVADGVRCFVETAFRYAHGREPRRGATAAPSTAWRRGSPPAAAAT